MDLDDRKNIKTPEGLDLDLTLAGLGSRMIAGVVDLVILGIVVVTFTFAVSALVSSTVLDATVVQGLAAVALTLLVVGYFVGFEALNGGRTPGKRSVGIRVVGFDGEPIGFLAAFLRNLVRVVDFLPMAYGVGAVTVAVTATNQRLGDLVARTIVIRERMPHAEPAEAPSHADLTDLPHWDVSGVTDQDVDILRRFAVRRRSIPTDRVEQIAEHLAAKIRPKVTGEGIADTPDTDFLITVLSLKLR